MNHGVLLLHNRFEFVSLGPVPLNLILSVNYGFYVDTDHDFGIRLNRIAIRTDCLVMMSQTTTLQGCMTPG